MRLGLRRVGAGGGRSGEIGWKLGGKDGGAGRGDEIFPVQGGKKSFFESCFDFSKHGIEEELIGKFKHLLFYSHSRRQ